VDISARKP